MRRTSSLSGGGLYRSRNGVILGVCRGVADYFDFSVFWIRAIVIILFIFTGFWPVIGLYVLGALLMKSEPMIHVRTESHRKFNGRYTNSKHDTADRLKRKWQYLEKRIRRMEDKITANQKVWF